MLKINRKKPSKKAIDAIKRKAIKNENRVHVFSSGNMWAIKKEGTSRASRVVSTKTEAEKLARLYVQKGAAKKIISHKNDGSFVELK